MAPLSPYKFNSRAHQRRTEAYLVLGGFAIIALLGSLVIWLLYGVIAALIGLLIVLATIALFGLFYFLLRLAERWGNSD
jgi:predicted lipid-binding transport protein (Tim44 family)